MRTPEQTISPGPGFEKKEPETKIDRVVAIGIIISLVTLFVVGGLIVSRLYLRIPQVRSALEREMVVFQDRLEKEPGDIDARVGIAQIYSRMGKTDEAATELKRALNMKPKYKDALFQLGLVYLNDGKKKQAVQQFKKAARAKPADGLAYFQLGIIAFKDKDYKEAAKYLEKTIKINPFLADAHYQLAVSYERTNKRSLSEHHYQEALRFIPDYAEAKKGLARVER